MRWLGIDFSGNHMMWKSSCQNSNVWIADVRGELDNFHLFSLAPVQSLKGHDSPFLRLAALLSKGDFLTAAIDAPFSIPHRFIGENGHKGLLENINSIACHRDRPFPKGEELLFYALPTAGQRGEKVYRVTEDVWREQGLSVRSTLWNGPRGGAPFTTACIKLLYLANRPIWPWADVSKKGLIVEAFPAAQLKTWGATYQGYNGIEKSAVISRMAITRALSMRISIKEEFRSILHENADALDAVIAAFGGIAVTTDVLASAHGPSASKEGWIAIHSE